MNQSVSNEADPLAATRETSWRLEAVRFSAFLRDVGFTDTTDWWKRLFDRDSDTQSRNKLEARTFEFGAVDGLQVTMTTDATRVDLHVVSDFNVAMRAGSLEALPELSPTLAFLRAAAEKWLALEVPVTRIALGAIALKPVEDRRLGYRLLDGYLPALKVDPDGSTDMVFRINRPRPSTSTPGMMVNRLSGWSTVVVNSAPMMAIDSNGAIHAVSPQLTMPASGATAVKIELDINSAPQTDLLPPSISVNLLGELVDLALEIAESGDVP